MWKANTDQTHSYAQTGLTKGFQCEHKLQAQNSDLLTIPIPSPWVTDAKVTVSKTVCSWHCSDARGAAKNCFGFDALFYHAHIWIHLKIQGLWKWTPLKRNHKSAPTIASISIGITILVANWDPWSLIPWLDSCWAQTLRSSKRSSLVSGSKETCVVGFCLGAHFQEV